MCNNEQVHECDMVVGETIFYLRGIGTKYVITNIQVDSSNIIYTFDLHHSPNDCNNIIIITQSTSGNWASKEVQKMFTLNEVEAIAGDSTQAVSEYLCKNKKHIQHRGYVFGFVTGAVVLTLAVGLNSYVLI